MAGHRRRPRPLAARVLPLARAAVTTAAATVTATAAALASAPTAAATPDSDPRTVKATVDRLYEEAESATEKYHAAKEDQEALQDRADLLQDQLARGQQRINRMRSGLGTVASAQYRGGAMDPSLGLVLSSDPGDYLDRASTLDRIGTRQAGRLRMVERQRRDLDQRRAEASSALRDLDRTRSALARHRSAVQGKLAAARRLLASLTEAQRAALGMTPGQGRAGGPATGGGGRGPHTAVLPARPGAALLPATQRAAVAVAAARRALGAPYVWASAGPRSFDCSGLTYWAYRQAGVSLPRTSQGQMHAGRRIPLSEARPGDLVIYRSDASHVALYVGGGQVIHAPRPGAQVRYDPVGMLPIASVNRM